MKRDHNTQPVSSAIDAIEERPVVGVEWTVDRRGHLTVRGEIDAVNVDDLNIALHSWHRAGRQGAIDMRDVTYIGPRGVETLMMWVRSGVTAPTLVVTEPIRHVIDVMVGVLTGRRSTASASPIDPSCDDGRPIGLVPALRLHMKVVDGGEGDGAPEPSSRGAGAVDARTVSSH